MVTSIFKVGTAGCAGQFTSSKFLGCGGLSGVSDTIFVSDLNDLPYEALSSTSSTDYALGMTVSRSSALSMNVLLIFYIADKDGALFLNAAFFSTL